MNYTDFIREVEKEESSVTWKDILEESFSRHAKEEVERAMQVGKPIAEVHMWEQWHRPWLWWTFAKYGLSLVAVLYSIFYIGVFFLPGVAESLVHMVMIIPPIVIPIVILILFWELNVPQDISFPELMGFFLAGGILSFVVTSLLYGTFPDTLPAYYAALREEPAKLVAVILILLYREKIQKKKIYGLTGLVVGAAVGAAFSGIESVSYAINNSGNLALMINVQLQRALFALGGHITYCVPYATAIALKSRESDFSVKSLLNPMAIGSFLFSTMLHAIWNGSGSIFVQLIILVSSIFILQYWTRVALHEAALIGRNASETFYHSQPKTDKKSTSVITICVKNTSLAGTRWQSLSEPIMIGRQPNVCRICFPDGTKGVSRQHCRIVHTNDGWFVQDLDSTYGTFAGGRKLASYEMYPLASGENIYLGSKQVWLVVM